MRAARHGGPIATPVAALAAVMLAFVLLAAPAAAAGDLPALTGRVVDNANLIDPSTTADITGKLAAFEAKSSDQVVVATIDSLNGEAIEPYANRLFRTWGLGQKKENNGILLLVAKNDRKVRIEVGYGLEGTMTDLAAKLIIENTILPAFRKGDFPGGIAKGVDDILSVLSGNEAELEARYARNRTSTASQSDRFGNIFFYVFMAIWFGTFFTGIFFAVLPKVFGKKIGPNRYRWLGHEFTIQKSSGRGGSWSSGGGFSSGGGGFSGGGGSSGGGGASGGW
jgi:uncharacterized protein